MQVMERGPDELGLEEHVRWAREEGEQNPRNEFDLGSLQVVHVIPKEWGAPRGMGTHPATEINFYEALAFANARGGQLPTEAEAEFAIRGPMDPFEENSRQFARWARNRENFVSGGNIYGDRNAPALRELLRSGARIGAWRMFPTEDGAFSDRIRSSVNNQKEGTRSVRESFENDYGLVDPVGNAYFWTTDGVKHSYEGLPDRNPVRPFNLFNLMMLRGGSGFNSDPWLFRPAFRCYYYAGESAPNLGFRVVRRVFAPEDSIP